LTSLVGNGAIILTISTPPNNLHNVVSVTRGNIIGIAWDVPTFNAGTPIIDYRIKFD